MKERENTGPEERLAELFQPDTLMPSQFFDRMRRRTEYEGERRLLIAVLEDAVDVYRKQAGARDVRGQEMFREAEEWIERLTEEVRSTLYSAKILPITQGRRKYEFRDHRKPDDQDEGQT